MDAIEMLMNEHRIIERVLDGLAGFVDEVQRTGGTEVDEVQRTGGTEKDELGRFVTFLREFADACHHGKEEEILFAAMVDHGFPSQGGPVAVMLREHDQGRGLVRILRGHAEQEAPWSDADRQEITAVASGVAELLRAHIHKEDAILYPMAEQHLPAQALEAVSDACEVYERAPERAGKHDALQALADALIRRHAGAVHPAPAPGHRGLGCCG